MSKGEKGKDCLRYNRCGRQQAQLGVALETQMIHWQLESRCPTLYLMFQCWLVCSVNFQLTSQFELAFLNSVQSVVFSEAEGLYYTACTQLKEYLLRIRRGGCLISNAAL